MKRLRQQLSMAEYEALYNRGNRKLRPVLIGPIWSRNPLTGVNKKEEEQEDSKDEIPSQKAFYSTVVGEDKENDKVAASTEAATTEGGEGNEESRRQAISEAELVLNGEILSSFSIYVWPEVVIPVSTFVKRPQAQQVERESKKFPPSGKLFLFILCADLIGYLEVSRI